MINKGYYLHLENTRRPNIRDEVSNWVFFTVRKRSMGQGNTVNKRAVHIPLECILVLCVTLKVVLYNIPLLLGSFGSTLCVQYMGNRKV